MTFQIRGMRNVEAIWDQLFAYWFVLKQPIAATSAMRTGSVALRNPPRCSATSIGRSGVSYPAILNKGV